MNVVVFFTERSITGIRISCRMPDTRIVHSVSDTSTAKMHDDGKKHLAIAYGHYEPRNPLAAAAHLRLKRAKLRRFDVFLLTKHVGLKLNPQYLIIGLGGARAICCYRRKYALRGGLCAQRIRHTAASLLTMPIRGRRFGSLFQRRKAI